MSWPTYLKDSSGNQIFAGGTIASDTLWLSSTGHATKGLIKFGASSAYDEVNTKLGIGTIAPSGSLQADVSTTATGTSAPSGVYLNNPTGATGGATVQHAPALRITGHSWNSALTADRQIDWRIQLRTASVSGDLGFAGFSGLFFNTVRTGLASQDKLVITDTGGYLLNGYAGIGTGVTDPSNTTGGDMTALRAHIGTDAAFSADISFEVNSVQMKQGGTIATATGGTGGVNYAADFSPIMTGGSNNAGINMSGTFKPAASPSAWQMGLRSLPLFDAPNGVTIPAVYCWALGYSTGSTAGGVISNVTAVLISGGYGSQKPAGVNGIQIGDLGAAGITTAIAINITGPSGSTNNYVFAVAGAGTTTHGGGAWGAAPTGWIDILVDNIARRLYFV